jgi:hypothetical protein
MLDIKSFFIFTTKKSGNLVTELIFFPKFAVH